MLYPAAQHSISIYVPKRNPHIYWERAFIALNSAKCHKTGNNQNAFILKMRMNNKW